MSDIIFANNAASTLAGNITNTATSANLAVGTGILFPNPGAGQYFVMTFTDAATGLLNEIIQVTAISGDTITMVRAQEGTTALNWLAGDLANNRLTAGQMAAMLQTAEAAASLAPAIQEQVGNYAVATGTNNYVITLSPVPASYTALIGVPIRVKFTNGNTSQSMTLNVNGLGAKNITRPSPSQPQTFFGDVQSGVILELVYDGTEFQLIAFANAATLGSGIARTTAVPNTNTPTTIFAAVQGVVAIYADQGGGNAFSDVVTFYQGGSVSVLSSSVGSPSTRAYSMASSTLLQLALTGGPGGATITPVVIQSNEPTP